VKKASGEIGTYISEKLAPQNIGIATEIASISVSVAELLVLPVGILFLLPVCTHCYSPQSGNVDTRGNGSGVP